MPVFEIEQYEIHTRKHRVEAKGEAEAIDKLLNGQAKPVANSLRFIEICDDVGLSVDDYADLADELRSLGVNVGDCIIPSIRSIEEVG